MSTPQAPDAEPSARIDIERIEHLDHNEIERIEAQLSTGTPPAALQELLADAFVR